MLATLGWDDGWAEALAAVPGHPELVPGRVTAVHRGRVRVRGDDLDVLASLAGIIEDQPLVGDWAGVSGDVVRTLLPRRSVLAREDGALAANADVAFVVSSLNHDLNVRRLERFAALARGGGVQPVVLLSKADLHPDPDAAVAEVGDRLGATVDVLAVSALDGRGIPALRERLAPRTTSVLVGMSGVGKSTLVNLLLGEDVQRVLGLRNDDRGRHATRHRELFVLEGGALLIDTPGIRAPSLADAEGVEETFADIAELAAGCRFADCRHDGEPGCAVQGVVAPERLSSMHRLQREGAEARSRRDRRRRS